MILERIFLS